MKKLMIAAAAAAMIGTGFAACNDAADCVAWDVSMKLKTLAPKKLPCKDACGDKSTVYYLDAATRTIKGYIWACEYDCEDSTDLNIVLWDSKDKVPVIALPPAGIDDYQTIEAGWADMIVYGKKADKVAVAFDIADAAGENISVKASAINGKVAKSSTTCYVKSLSGYAVGEIAPVVNGKKTNKNPVVNNDGLCGDIEINDCVDDEEDLPVLYTTLCEICCDWDGWCESGEELDRMVPAVGTWSMKYNKKMSLGNKTIYAYAPNYAL